MRLLRVVLTASFVAGTSFVGPTFASEVTAQTVTTSPMDRAACAQLRADILSSQVSDSIKGAARKATDADCWTRREQSWSETLPFGVESAAASAGCGGYWTNFVVGFGGIVVANSHTNVGLCWNGTTFTGGSLGGGINWGPDCYVSTSIGYFGGIDWCGVYWPNAGHTIAEPGNNFWVAAYPIPWWHRFGWVRFDVRATNGSSYNLRGGCCT
jgi:hypothetical protein